MRQIKSREVREHSKPALNKYLQEQMCLKQNENPFSEKFNVSLTKVKSSTRGSEVEKTCN